MNIDELIALLTKLRDKSSNGNKSVYCYHNDTDEGFVYSGVIGAEIDKDGSITILTR